MGVGFQCWCVVRRGFAGALVNVADKTISDYGRDYKNGPGAGADRLKDALGKQVNGEVIPTGRETLGDFLDQAIDKLLRRGVQRSTGDPERNADWRP